MATLDLQVEADADDGTCFLKTSTWIGTEVNIGMEGTDGPYNTFCRFANVTIPNGAIIGANSYLTFTCRTAKTVDTVRVKISCEDADNPSAPNSCASLAGRARTSAGIDWHFTTDWVVDTEYDAIVTAPLQEVVNRPGWASGQAMNLIIDNDGSDTEAIRLAYAHETDNAKAVKIHIEYTPFRPRLMCY